MLRRLWLRDFIIVRELDVEPGPGFTALTGETGAGKSILIDALQLALGSRGDAAVVREGASRAEISAEFDRPKALPPFSPGFPDIWWVDNVRAAALAAKRGQARN